MYFIAMGEPYPEIEKPVQKSRKRKLKKETTIGRPATRKSPRLCPDVDYKDNSLKKDGFKKIIPNSCVNSEVPNLSENKENNGNKEVKYCDLCHSEFETVVLLKTHMNMSHKRTLYNCPVCELTMYSKENLKRHYKHNH